MADGVLGDLLPDLDQGILDSLWCYLVASDAPIHNILEDLNWIQCEPALIDEENWVPMADLPVLVFSGKCQLSCTVLGYPVFHSLKLITLSTAMADGVDLSRKFVSESEIEERRKKRQEEWEKVRKPDDPEEVPEEEYDPRSLFERLQEQKDKKQEEYEEQFKFKNMVKGLDEDEAHFLDEVSRQQCLVEKQRRDEEKQELQEYRISFHFVAHTHSVTQLLKDC
ncbi:hypothetical protein PGIGA_G00224930 [Pangasianodon gigas]|uniref:Uncharacterized protein n=1 Tax=Pangasianodon gigas TaxID=30993 RepID=A0ACC5WJA5_PANGG|nr:hypothetical protein [Pangasianodon gigas]